jgi:hypothetical protein
MATETLRQRLAPQLDELRGNTRLRLGLWLIAGILLVYMILVSTDRLAALRDERAAALERLAQVETLAAEEDIWAERAAQARALEAELQRRMWTSATPGLAQAQLQAWLQNTARNAGIGDARIMMRDVATLAGGDGLWLAAGTMTAPFQPSALPRLLFEVESAVPRVQIESLTVNNGRRKSLQMTVSAVFQASGDPSS